jgi:hypothetical protein
MSNKSKKTPADEWCTDETYMLPIELCQKFYDKVIKLAEEMFGRDCDNHLPVDIHIIDRTRFEPVHFIEVPYRHKIEDIAKSKLNNRYDEPTAEQRKEVEEEKQEKLEDMLHDLAVNASMAMDRLKSELQIRRHHHLEKRLKKEKK